MAEVLGDVGSTVMVMDMVQELSATILSARDSTRDPSFLLDLHDEILIIETLLLTARDTLEGQLLDGASPGYSDEIRKRLRDLVSVLHGLKNQLPSAGVSNGMRGAPRTAFLKSKSDRYLHQVQDLRKEIQVLLLGDLEQSSPQRPVSLGNVLESLSPLDFSGRQQELLTITSWDPRCSFLDNGTFKEWIETPGKVLWCTGKPGSGKTTQCSLVVKYLSQMFKAPDFVGYVYFDLKPYDPTEIVGSLIKQFALSSLSDVSGKLKAWDLVRQTGDRRRAFNLAAKILANVLQNVGRAFLVFDAMDEYPGHAEEFVHDLVTMMNIKNTNILMTSRRPQSGRGLFDDALRLEIRASEPDIQNFIRHRLSTSVTLATLTSEKTEFLVKEISRKASGVFLWISLMLQQIESHELPPDLESRLVDIPANLEDLYSRILARLMQRPFLEGQLAIELLTWLTFARTPLTLDQIQAALAIHVGESNPDTSRTTPVKSLIELCMGLVTVDQDERVSPVHLSLKDFLQRWIPKQSGSASESPHAFIMRKCLVYLRLKRFSTQVAREPSVLLNRLTEYSFLQYAAVHWGYHARICYNDGLRADILGLLQSDYATEAAGLTMALYEAHPGRYDEAYSGMTGLHLAAAFGLGQVAVYLIRNEIHSMDSLTEGHWTALHWSSRRGFEDVVRALLDEAEGERLNDLMKMTTKLDEWTPLHLAAKEGHLPVVELLYRAGADLDSIDVQGRSPLYLACWGMHLSVVRFLLSKGADPNFQNIHGMTALHCATKTGKTDLVNEILTSNRHQLKINTPDSLGLTALDEAIRKGHKPVVQLLKAKGANRGSRTLSQPSMLESTPPEVWKSVPNDSNWTLYQLDSEKTNLITSGVQCSCKVLKKPGTPERRVFRKTFDITKDRGAMTRGDGDTSTGKQKYSLSERQILYTLRHPHVVLYLDSDSDPEMNVFHLYTEYCDMGDLHSRHAIPSNVRIENMKDRRLGFIGPKDASNGSASPLSGVDIWGLIWQLSSALAYLHYGLTMRHEAGAFKAAIENEWEYIIHRDVKPANVVKQSVGGEKHIFKLCDLGIATPAGQGEMQNRTQWIGSRGLQPPEVREGDRWSRKGDIFCLRETIRLTCKLKDTLLDSEPFNQFMKRCGSDDESERMSSLCIMQTAYEVLLVNDRTQELPSPVIDEMVSAHKLLACGEGGYLLRTVRCVGDLLDGSLPFGDAHSKEHRRSTIKRLEELFEDGGKKPFLDHPDEYSVHLLVLLERPQQDDAYPHLEQLVSSGASPNVTWKVSGWTPLHLAAQEGKQVAVDLLMNHGADARIVDVHGLTPGDYAREANLTQMAEKLRISPDIGQ